MAGELPTRRCKQISAAEAVALAIGRGGGGRGGLRGQACGQCVLHGRGDHRSELLEVHRLAQVVEGAGLERLDGILGRAIGGDDHAALAALQGAQALDQLDAQPVGQAHIGDQHLVAALQQLLPGTGHGFCHIDAVAFAQQGQLVERAQIGLVVHDQDAGVRAGGCCRHGAESLRAAAGLATDRRRAMKNSLPSIRVSRAMRRARW
jgi:hypothetical protein